jgi:hydroxyethylthiazole kinase-like uncharacterized protein yjeF
MRPILTAAEMRAAEQHAIDAGATVEQLMARAGEALADATYRFAGPRPALVLCGPGNNGGDGYVAAKVLAERGVAVRVVAAGEPRSAACVAAARAWTGPVEALGPDTQPDLVLVDALFGTGLNNAVEPSVVEQLFRLRTAAQIAIACDLPSGIQADSGAELSPVPDFDLTVTFGALKPAHRLMPAILKCGRVALADIGVAVASTWHEAGRPQLPPLDPAAHKYGRGRVQLYAGTMPGAISLAATAALRGGAGFVSIEDQVYIHGAPAAAVQEPLPNTFVQPNPAAVIVIGPGRGDLEIVKAIVDQQIRCVLDATALLYLRRSQTGFGNAVLTPHSGEFDAMVRPDDQGRSMLSEAERAGTKADRTLALARKTDGVIVHKGPDTVIAAPDGRVCFAPPAPAWLATAGTGDVLAGLIAALWARGLDRYDAACAGVWVHGRAAEVAGPHMIADDLAAAIPAALDLL